MKLQVHGSYIGHTGYNHHTRDFLRRLQKYCDIRVRNFSIGNSWTSMNETPHDGEPYITDQDKQMLYQQTLWTEKPHRADFKMYQSPDKEFEHDIDLVLSETNHHYFYDHYDKPKIAYNVWESTLQPDSFFEQLKLYDEMWVPSEWQKEVTIKQGFDPNRIKVVPEGVDDSTFFPEEIDSWGLYSDGRFKFILFGRWDYRKSIKEIIQTFLKTFDKNEPVDLIVSIDNPFGKEIDGMSSTEERLKFYGLEDERIKILHFPSREDYVKYLKTGHVFLSCARSEGWNLPLIESMASGTPSIYSECSAQMQFAQGKGHPVRIVGEKPAIDNNYGRFTMSDLVGNYYEPDFEHLSQVMRDVYVNYSEYKQKALIESEDIRKKFNWDEIGRIGYETLQNFHNKVSDPNYEKPIRKNSINISFINGPKVEIFGDEDKEYFVEFLDGDNVVHQSTIKNNMWTNCGRQYYTNWTIKINGEVYHQFNPEGKRILISFDSRSIGDTIAWAPYAVEFAKTYNCKVILSTFHNNWFQGVPEYDNIDFLPPGSEVGCYAHYKIGWFRGSEGKWDKFDMYPNAVNTIPLQKTATDILGLEYKEVNYGLSFKPKDRPIKAKYVVFGPQSTAGCKEWPYDNWVTLSKMLRDLGYKVVILSSTDYKISQTQNIVSQSWETVTNYLYHADAFVGLGSGLSWFNWALGKHTYMINGFSEEGHEFSSNMTKITNNVCIKCWNDTAFSFDAGDWHWCPVYKGTEKQHICQKSITPLQVFNTLQL